MRWVKGIAVGALVLLGFLLAGLFGIIGFDAAFGEQSDQYSNVTYEAEDGTTLHGYLATPEDPGPHPGVLMIHEWWGLTEEITVLADELAAEGYVVLAADAYRTEVTDLVPRALWLRLTTPTEQIHGDLDDALAYLMAREDVDPERTATLGFCFGGEQSLQLALRHPEQLETSIIYYGSLVTDAELLRPLTGGPEILGIFGAEDRQIPVSEVEAFEAALNQLEIPNRVIIYEGVGHAFLNAENFDGSGAPGEAWQVTLEFLAETLR